MKALDLFCGAGGASMGIYRMGFEVVGVDIVPQPEYPFQFILGDALDIDLFGYDFIWASPPCQAFTAYKRRPFHVKERPNLIPLVRNMLQNQNAPWVIENVPGAPLESPFQLCGSSFGLDVRRHRIFESSFEIIPPDCNHNWQTSCFAQATNRKNKRRTVEVGVWRIPLEIQQRAMGIDWMSLRSLSESIPPAYSEFIVRYLLNRIGLENYRR